MVIPYMPSAPLIIVCGHFGSGKTNVSTALALALRETGKEVTLVDLDIVNPYFRAADSASLLAKHGIKCIIPQFANTNVDVPSLGAEVTSAFVGANESHIAVFDVGGDNGAAALGQYRREFTRLGYNMLCVINKYRPLTDTSELAADDLREIEYYARLSCTHIVNNSNVGVDTTREYIEASFGFSDEVCSITGLPEAFTSLVRAPFCDSLVKDNPKKKFFVINDTTKKLF